MKADNRFSCGITFSSALYRKEQAIEWKPNQEYLKDFNKINYIEITQNINLN